MHYKNNKLEQGLSLIELLLVIAAVSILGILIASFPSAIASINKSRHISIAKDIASREIDVLRKQTYDSLSNGTSLFTDENLPILNQASATYDIEDCQPSVCGNEEEIKQVKVKVAWNELGDDKVVSISTLIGKGGIGQ